MEASGHSYRPVPGKIPGRAINLGGHDFVLPPLNLDGVRIAQPLFLEFEKHEHVADSLEMAAKILHIALVRNYPKITEADVAALLDTGNAIPALAALASLSGFKAAPLGETRPASP